MAHEIAFVGNAPAKADLSGAIDGADHVVRFNNTRGFGGWTGRRIDDLFLVNCGGQAHEWLGDSRFWTAPPLAATPRVSLPVASHDRGSGLAAYARATPAARHGVNFEHDIRRRLAACGVAVRTLPERLRLDAIDALARIGRPPTAPIWPSTGFLALYWYDRTAAPDACLALYGYGFSGWAGHAWDRERAWVEARSRSGRIRLHAAPSRSDAA